MTFLCKVVPSLLCFGLTFLILFVWNDLFKLLQIIPILWIIKNSWTKDGFTWSNSMDLHFHNDIKS